MLIRVLGLVALMTTAAFADGPAFAPDASGPMTLAYLPIMCVVPPCPPGQYRISTEDGFVAEGDVVIITVDGQTTQYRGMYLDYETFTGAVWVGGDGKVDQVGIPTPEGVLVIDIVAR